MKPSIGRIVHFVQGDIHLPAMIVRVWGDIMLNLQVFTDGANSEPVKHSSDASPNLKWVTSVSYDGSGAPAERTWHWPEQV
jgi:hypothetical protein